MFDVDQNFGPGKMDYEKMSLGSEVDQFFSEARHAFATTPQNRGVFGEQAVGDLFTSILASEEVKVLMKDSVKEVRVEDVRITGDKAVVSVEALGVRVKLGFIPLNLPSVKFGLSLNAKLRGEGVDVGVVADDQRVVRGMTDVLKGEKTGKPIDINKIIDEATKAKVNKEAVGRLQISGGQVFINITNPNPTLSTPHNEFPAGDTVEGPDALGKEVKLEGMAVVERLDRAMALLPGFVEDMDLSKPNAINILVQSQQRAGYELLRDMAPTALSEYIWFAGRMEGTSVVLQDLSTEGREELDQIKGILTDKFGFEDRGDSAYGDLYRTVTAGLGVERDLKKIPREVLLEIREFASQNGMPEPLPPNLERKINERFGDIFDVGEQGSEKANITNDTDPVEDLAQKLFDEEKDKLEKEFGNYIVGENYNNADTVRRDIEKLEKAGPKAFSGRARVKLLQRKDEAKDSKKPGKLTLSAQEIHQRFMEEPETISLSELAKQYDFSIHNDLLERFQKGGNSAFSDSDWDENNRLGAIRSLIYARVAGSIGDKNSGLLYRHLKVVSGEQSTDFQVQMINVEKELVDFTLRYFRGETSELSFFIDWVNHTQRDLERIGVEIEISAVDLLSELTIDNPWADEANQISFSPTTQPSQKSEDKPDVSSQAPPLLNETPPTSTPLEFEVAALPKVEPEYEEEPENIANYRQSHKNFQNAIDELAYSEEQLASYLVKGKRVRVGVSSPGEEFAKARLAKNRKLFRKAFNEYRGAFKNLPTDLTNTKHPLPQSEGVNGKEWTDFLTEFLGEFDKLLPERKKISPDVSADAPIAKTEPSTEPKPASATALVTEDKSEVLSSVRAVDLDEKRGNAETQIEPGTAEAWMKKYLERDSGAKNHYHPIYELRTGGDKSLYVFFDIHRKRVKEKGMEFSSIYIEDGQVFEGKTFDAENSEVARKEMARLMDQETREGMWSEFKELKWPEDRKAIESLLEKLKSLSS